MLLVPLGKDDVIFERTSVIFLFFISSSLAFCYLRYTEEEKILQLLFSNNWLRKNKQQKTQDDTLKNKDQLTGKILYYRILIEENVGHDSVGLSGFEKFIHYIWNYKHYINRLLNVPLIFTSVLLHASSKKMDFILSNNRQQRI